MKKNCKKQIQQDIELKKVTKRKGDKLLSNGKAMMIHLIAALIKRMYDSHHIKMNDLSKLDNVANNDAVKKTEVEYLKFI